MSLKQGHLSTLYDLMFFIPTVSLFSGVFINIIFTFIANLTKCFALIIKNKNKKQISQTIWDFFSCKQTLHF